MHNDCDIRAVLFDLDDTLFDHQYSSRKALEAVHAHPAIAHWDFAALELKYHELVETMHVLVLSGEMTVDESRVARFKTLARNTLPEDDLRWLVGEYVAAYDGNRRAVPGAADLLSILGERLRIGVVTNHLRAAQEKKLRDCGVETLIDVMVTSEEAGEPKPHPRTFEMVMDALEVTSAEVVMVGDSWSSDVIGATGLGIRTIWLNRYGLECPDPSLAMEISSLEPVGDVVELIGTH